MTEDNDRRRPRRGPGKKAAGKKTVGPARKFGAGAPAKKFAGPIRKRVADGERPEVPARKFGGGAPAKKFAGPIRKRVADGERPEVPARKVGGGAPAKKFAGPIRKRVADGERPEVPARKFGGGAPAKKFAGPPKGDRAQKTLERVISKAGLGSRTDARQWIGTGRVHVNGRLIQTPDHWVDMDRDRVTLDGKPLVEEEKVYILLYKPKGYITTYKDPEGRPTVYDLIADVKQFVGTVGRLDQDSTGLLLLTNDTRWAERVMSPDHHVAKTYLVKVSVVLTDNDLENLRTGVELADGLTKPAEVKRVRDSEKYSFMEITIYEGRNRQVRRMIEAVGGKVLKLVRTGIGKLEIGDLPIGKYRYLTPAEARDIIASR